MKTNKTSVYLHAIMGSLFVQTAIYPLMRSLQMLVPTSIHFIGSGSQFLARNNGRYFTDISFRQYGLKITEKVTLKAFIETTLSNLKTVQEDAVGSTPADYITNIASYHISRNTNCNLLYTWLSRVAPRTGNLAIHGGSNAPCASKMLKVYPKTVSDIAEQIIQCPTCRQNFENYAKELDQAIELSDESDCIVSQKAHMKDVDALSDYEDIGLDGYFFIDEGDFDDHH